MKRVAAALATAAILTGCVSMPSQQDIDSATYVPVPDNYQELIKEDMGKILIDPYTAMYEFTSPRKGALPVSRFKGQQPIIGYVVCGTVNSKNQMGGYAGRLPFAYAFNDGAIKGVLVGNPPGDFYQTNSGPNQALRRICQGAK